MGARAVSTVIALALMFYAPATARYYKPDATILVKASPTREPVAQNVEKRYTPELAVQLHQVKSDALLLYTEYCSKAATDLKCFINNVTALVEDTRQRAYTTLASSPERCRYDFQTKLHKIEMDAHKASTFSTEAHHKFLLGHMIVFRMHLNKSEEYLRRCERTAKTCGVPCQTMARQVFRWRRLALCEINRVRDDVQHARKSYADLIVHAYRKLNHLRKHTDTKLQNALTKLLECPREPYQNDQPNEGK